MEITLDSLGENQSKVIDIPSQKHYSLFSTFLAMLVLLLVPTVASYFGGYYFGRYQAINNTTERVTNFKAKAAPSGMTAYVDKDNAYQIDYPAGWTTTKKTGALPGVTLVNGENTIDVWIGVERPVTLSAEQKAAVTKTNNVDLKIGSQKAKMIEYAYTAGNFYSVATLTATVNSPTVTFWIKAVDLDSYNQAKAVVQTFSF